MCSSAAAVCPALLAFGSMGCPPADEPLAKEDDDDGSMLDG